MAIDSVAPSAMFDFDWGFFKNSAVIANPLAGDHPILMDVKTFHGAFANTLSEADAALAFEETAKHDSRNVLRDCLGPDGRIDLDKPHASLLLIGGERDQIIPAHLTEKNFKGYTDTSIMTLFRFVPGPKPFHLQRAGLGSGRPSGAGLHRSQCPLARHFGAFERIPHGVVEVVERSQRRRSRNRSWPTARPGKDI